MLPIAEGWFAVAIADEIAPGSVKPLHYFGRDLVVFRTEAGESGVFDAHCPHLGAHFGHGGRVEGEALRCPFHGWQFGTDGACTTIPYAKRIPPSARAGAWQVRERNGFILTWHDALGREPWYEVPEWAEATSPEWSTPDRYEWSIGVALQEMGENGVDSAHFQFVHGTQNVPVTDTKQDGPYREAYSPIELKTPRGDVTGGIHTKLAGMGFSATRFTGICETLEFAVATPIDTERTHMRYAFLQPKVGGKDPVGGVAAAIIKDIVKQTNEDIPIWENKVYRPHPVLCDGDGPIAEYRSWCKQFHPQQT